MLPRYIPPVYSSVLMREIVSALAGHAAVNEAGAQYALAASSMRAELGVTNVVLTNSGTSALTLALSVALRRVRANARATSGVVALPAYCCPDVATAAIANSMRIALYDVDPHTLMPDWESVRGCLARGAEILVVTHLYGRLVDVPLAMNIAGEFGAVVVEDAAQGAGGAWLGRPAGTTAPLGIMSFGRGKGANAGGGGALLLSGAHESPDFAELVTELPELSSVASIMALAKTLVGEVLSAPWLYGIPARLPLLGVGETNYHAPTPVMRISRASALLLPTVMRRQPGLAAARRDAQEWYRQQLDGVAGVLFEPDHPSSTSGALRMPVRLSPERAHTLRHLGVARSYPRTLADYGEVQGALTSAGELPGARTLASQVHTLPTHELISHAEREQIVGALRRR